MDSGTCKMSTRCIFAALQRYRRDAEHVSSIEEDSFSEQVGLLHDAEELLLIHLAITIPISLVYHLLEFLVCHALSQFLRHPLQILEGYLACLIVVEKSEGFEDFIFGVTVQDLVG